MRRGSRAAGAGAAICWTLFVITLVIRLTAGNGGLLAAEMMENAPPERTGLPETEYPGVGEMTAGYLTGKRDEFQYTFTNVSGEEYVCFQPHEAAHMADCRGLILLDGWVCLGTLAAGLGLAAAGLRRKENRGDFLRGILTGLGILAAVAAGMAIWAAVNFDGLFVTFHRVAFRNDGWLLDPRTDLLIRLMPESFFIRLGLRGGAISLAGAAALAAAAGIGLYLRKKRDKQ